MSVKKINNALSLLACMSFIGCNGYTKSGSNETHAEVAAKESAIGYDKVKEVYGKVLPAGPKNIIMECLKKDKYGVYQLLIVNTKLKAKKVSKESEWKDVIQFRNSYIDLSSYEEDSEAPLSAETETFYKEQCTFGDIKGQDKFKSLICKKTNIPFYDHTFDGSERKGNRVLAILASEDGLSLHQKDANIFDLSLDYKLKLFDDPNYVEYENVYENEHSPYKIAQDCRWLNP